MSNKTKIILGLLVLVLIVGPAMGLLIFDQKLKKIERAQDEKVTALQNQITNLQSQLSQTGSITADLAGKVEANADLIKNGSSTSPDDTLTQTVAKATPAVVSIVISKDVPQLEIVYVNPFGDDPMFNDIPMRVPVYRQKGTQKQKVGGGSGFIYRSDGYIITNRHVVEDPNASYTVLMQNGKTAEASIVYRDTVNDFAIVKINAKNLPTVPLGNSDSLKLGQSVIAIGNALAEYSNSVSRGIISGLNREITAGSNSGSENLKGVIQTDAAINPGNSGGPLLNANGEAIGINVATVSGSNNISFSIPINQIKALLKKVK